MGQMRTRRNAEAWWELVQQQTASGLSQAAFCAAEDLPFNRLQYWTRKFVREGRLPAGTPPAPATPWFAELAVGEPAVDRTPPDSPMPPDWQVELDLGGGVMLRIHRAGGC